MPAPQVLRHVHRFSRFSNLLFNTDPQVYRVRKSNGNLIFDLDEKVARECLDAEGISGKYQEKVASALKEAAEDLTTELRFKVGDGFFQDNTLPRVALNYILGFSCGGFAIDSWFKYYESCKMKALKKAEKKAENELVASCVECDSV